MSMALMIPDMPKEFDPKSHEGIMFEELNELSDDYYVFHSFAIVTLKGNLIAESETDFVIFHPKKVRLNMRLVTGNMVVVKE